MQPWLETFRNLPAAHLVEVCCVDLLDA